MGEVESAHAARGKHGQAFGKRDACPTLGIQQAPERPFLGVVGLRWIASGGTDATVFLADNFLRREVFIFSKAPDFAGFFMQEFGVGLGKAITDGLRHNREVVVVLLLVMIG